MQDIYKSLGLGELVRIQYHGAAIRAFQEDNNVTASWGYTVGLKDKAGNPICVFIRAPIEASLIDVALSRIVEDIKNGEADILTKLQQPFYMMDLRNTEDETSPGMRMIMRRFSDSMAIEMRTLFNNYIETQEPKTKFYWALFADSKGHLPGESDYCFPGQLETTVENGTALPEGQMEEAFDD